MALPSQTICITTGNVQTSIDVQGCSPDCEFVDESIYAKGTEFIDDESHQARSQLYVSGKERDGEFF